jgi:hypothetical protein
MLRNNPYEVSAGVIRGSDLATNADKNAAVFNRVRAPPVRQHQGIEDFMGMAGKSMSVDHEGEKKQKQDESKELADLYYKVQYNEALKNGLVQPFQGLPSRANPYHPEHSWIYHADNRRAAKMAELMKDPKFVAAKKIEEEEQRLFKQEEEIYKKFASTKAKIGSKRAELMAMDTKGSAKKAQKRVQSLMKLTRDESTADKKVGEKLAPIRKKIAAKAPELKKARSYLEEAMGNPTGPSYRPQYIRDMAAAKQAALPFKKKDVPTLKEMEVEAKGPVEVGGMKIYPGMSDGGLSRFKFSTGINKPGSLRGGGGGDA